MNAHVVSPLVRPPSTMLGPEPVIAAGSVTLRGHRLADADAIAASLADGRVSSMLARVPAPYFRQDALDWLVPVTSGLLPGWRLAVTCGDDTHLGSVSIEPRRGVGSSATGSTASSGARGLGVRPFMLPLTASSGACRGLKSERPSSPTIRLRWRSPASSVSR